MKLTSRAYIQIQKPIEEVFAGIVDPDKLTKYFISESSGRMDTGKEVVWKFPEFAMEIQVKSIEIETDRSISFAWDPATRVNITLETQPDKSTLVTVTEGEKELSEENFEWVIENTGGWANFLACMKAYLEYDIQLRKGAFDFMRKK